MENAPETCTLSNGNFRFLKLDKFSIDLNKFLNGKVDPVFQNSRYFLKNTFLASKIKLVLKDLLLQLTKRLATLKKKDTGFGDSKIYTIPLFHSIYNIKERFSNIFLSITSRKKKFQIIANTIQVETQFCCNTN